MNKYPENIMRILRERKGLEPDDNHCDAELQHMSREEVFSEVLNWDGLIHYDWRIRCWIMDIFKIDIFALEDKNADK